MKIGKLFLTAVTFCSVASLQAQSGTQIVAHRGYWKTEGSAQNSIASLEKAIEIGCRGSEIDLILTTDGVLVLHHDDAIAGKRVDASTYAEIKDVKLSNGESLPTFDAFLAVARTQKGTKPIIEIKPHQTKQKEDAAVRAALDAVRRAGMNKRVEYISFSKNICEQLIANGPKGIKVAYLGGDLSPRELAERGYTGLDYHIGTMRAHEEWFDEARKLGLEINVWTVNDEGSMKCRLHHDRRTRAVAEPSRQVTVRGVRRVCWAQKGDLLRFVWHGRECPFGPGKRGGVPAFAFTDCRS